MAASYRKRALAEENDMSHPMDGYLEASRAERDRLYDRRDKMEERLKPLPLSAFTFEQFADLQLVADSNAPSDRTTLLEEALDRLEKFLDRKKRAVRTRRRKKR
ncbi:MAG: hypothetical protein QY323_05640 [Patescibacteria group bacterium]|nr:MAG: hypothetical protein QY323_05640 [Patescibacteria group bacterium]